MNLNEFIEALIKLRESGYGEYEIKVSMAMANCDPEDAYIKLNEWCGDKQIIIHDK